MRHDGKPYKSGFARGYYSEGQAKIILTVLSGRGITMPEAARKQIIECTEHEQFEKWGHRAGRVHSIDDLFD